MAYLHDIGRFPQWRDFNTFNNYISVDCPCGNSVDYLTNKNGYNISNHNKKEICVPENLRLYCKEPSDFISQNH